MTDPNRKLRTGDKAPWPKGRRRNNPRLPKPYRSLETFLRDVKSCCEEPGRSKTELAKRLRVRRGTLHAWLNGGYHPDQRAVDIMHKYLKGSRNGR